LTLDRTPPENLRVTTHASLAENATTTRCTVSVEFARSLRRHVDCPPQSVDPGSLREVLLAALETAPALVSYVFDDQQAIRKHVAVFVNDEMVQDRVRLDLQLEGGDRVLVIQALTGG
jgi:sulfur-carrier protein